VAEGDAPVRTDVPEPLLHGAGPPRQPRRLPEAEALLLAARRPRRGRQHLDDAPLLPLPRGQVPGGVPSAAATGDRPTGRLELPRRDRDELVEGARHAATVSFRERCVTWPSVPCWPSAASAVAWSCSRRASTRRHAPSLVVGAPPSFRRVRGGAAPGAGAGPWEREGRLRDCGLQDAGRAGTLPAGESSGGKATGGWEPGRPNCPTVGRCAHYSTADAQRAGWRLAAVNSQADGRAAQVAAPV
jgi:hypothetical protein